MDIVLVGVNHKTAPVEMRERVAFSDNCIDEALSALVGREGLEEGLIVSTCNRVELLASAPDGIDKGLTEITSFLCDFHSLTINSLNGHLYKRTGEDAIKHIFRVTSSLDSMVVGEPQILGQVKDAYHAAVKAGSIGRVLTLLMDRAISVARRVRNETGISLNAVSVSSVAVELGMKIFGDLQGKTVLLVGAGEMAELAAKNLVEAGAAHLIVTNRTPEKAEAIAHQFGGATVGFDAFYDILPTADVVICSTGAPDFVINYAAANKALKLRKKGPIVFVDIAVPRNIDPQVSDIANCFVFDIDDLQSVVETNLKERERQAQVAETIIESEVQRFIGSLRTMDFGPVVLELKKLLNDMAVAEMKRNRKHLGSLTQEQEEAIQNVLIPALVNKLSHPMIVHMRASMREGERSPVLDEIRKMVRLD